jgi:phosphoribosylglycinamide formyltransferase-1
MKERLAILISGSGTTMEYIVRAVKTKKLALEIACVISSNPKAGGITKAKHLGINKRDIIVIDPKRFKQKNGKIDQNKFSLALLKVLKNHKVTIITQNGWLPLTPKKIITEYQNRIFNQHPGPVPDFGGKGMYGRRVHAAIILFRRMTGGQPWTEVVAQRVAKDFDQGSVVKKAKVRILASDTVEDLQQRALPAEHKLQIKLLKDIIQNKVEESKTVSIVKEKEKKSLKLAKSMAALLYPNG